MSEWIVIDAARQAQGADSLVERRFADDITLAENDPNVLFCDVGNAEAQATLEAPHIDLVVDAGL